MDRNFVLTTSAKAGAIVGGVQIVLGLLGLIPIVGCITGLIGCVVLFMPGVLAAHLLYEENTATPTAQGAMGGAVAGCVATLLSVLVVFPVQILVGGGSMMSQMMSQGGGPDAMAGAGMGIGVMIVAGIVGGIIGAIISAAINAGTGALYLVIKNR